MAQIDVNQIQEFLTEVGRRYQQPSTLLLLGGSALCLLGSTRPTLDIDYVGDDLAKNDLQRVIDQVAHDMRLDVEAVPIAQFIPLPSNAQERSLSVGQFGQVTVAILDPYAMALSKIDRGFDSDIEDVVFLVQRNLITLDGLEAITYAAFLRASEFDMSPSDIMTHLKTVEDILNRD